MPRPNPCQTEAIGLLFAAGLRKSARNLRVVVEASHDEAYQRASALFLSRENGVSFDIADDEVTSEIKKDLADPETEVCYSVSFELRIAVVRNSPNVVTNEGIDEVIRDLKAKLPNVIRYRHSVGCVPLTLSAVAQRYSNLALVVVKGDLMPHQLNILQEIALLGSAVCEAKQLGKVVGRTTGAFVNQSQQSRTVTNFADDFQAFVEVSHLEAHEVHSGASSNVLGFFAPIFTACSKSLVGRREIIARHHQPQYYHAFTSLAVEFSDIDEQRSSPSHSFIVGRNAP